MAVEGMVALHAAAALVQLAVAPIVLWLGLRRRENLLAVLFLLSGAGANAAVAAGRSPAGLVAAGGLAAVALALHHPPRAAPLLPPRTLRAASLALLAGAALLVLLALTTSVPPWVSVLGAAAFAAAVLASAHALAGRPSQTSSRAAEGAMLAFAAPALLGLLLLPLGAQGVRALAPERVLAATLPSFALFAAWVRLARAGVPVARPVAQAAVALGASLVLLAAAVARPDWTPTILALPLALGGVAQALLLGSSFAHAQVHAVPPRARHAFTTLLALLALGILLLPVAEALRRIAGIPSELVIVVGLTTGIATAVALLTRAIHRDAPASPELTQTGRERGAAGDDGGPRAPGDVLLGRYRVERALGSGASGATYHCVDERLGRAVAVKEVRAERYSGPEARAGAMREARLLANVRHPNVVLLHDVERTQRGTLLIMELVEGGSLRERLAQGPLPAPVARAVLADVLRGLAALHAQGLVHRDLKSSNVLLETGGAAKVADLGIARASADTTVASGAARTGTPLTMAPEQVLGDPVDARTDVYAAGALLYECLAGESYLRPALRAGVSIEEGIVARPPPLPLAGAPPWADRFLVVALAKDPRERFPDAGAALRALETDDDHASTA